MGKKLRFLVVDDEQSIREVISHVLNDAFECKIDLASNGKEAFEYARDLTYDLIITDFKMPKLSGGDLISALRENDHNQETPILLYSGYIGDAQTDLNKLYHDIHFLEKPSDPAKLTSVLQSLVKNEEVPEDLSDNTPSEEVTKEEETERARSFYDLLVEATVHSISKYFNATVTDVGDIKPFQKPLDNIHASATVTIYHEQYNGFFSISFPRETYMNILDFLGDSEDDPNFAATEVLNVIYGKAMRDSKAQGMEKAIPVQLDGANYAHFEKKVFEKRFFDKDALLVEFESSLGPFYINFFY